MNPPILRLSLAIFAFASFSLAQNHTPPKSLESSACKTPPQIDGLVGEDEWKDSKVHTWDIPFLRIDPAMTEKRAAEFRVMNSANGLYVALTVPDSTVDERLSPIVLDSVVLAFSKDGKSAVNSDRKEIAKNLYRDKFMQADGKNDADDPQQDGMGAMSRKEGRVSFEWAIKLDCGDKQDLQTKPGASVRFNLVYFDALQLPLTKSIMGGVYGPVLDKVDAWGELKLAKDVQDDGGAAFSGPAWAKDVAKSLDGIAPGRFKVAKTYTVAGRNPPAVAASVEFSYTDPKGQPAKAKARVYFPPSFALDGKSHYPLFVYAGYELNDGGALSYLQRGWIVVTPSELPTNPLIRLVNPDVALMHFARRMPWIDDSKVIVSGGSAGGWMTLMLAAETFPLAGAAPDVPVVNWGYNAKYFFSQLEKAGPKDGKGAAQVPVYHMVGTMLKPSVDVHGDNYDDETWFASSPVSQAPTITCPVSVFWTTADVLVPIDQVGKQWVRGLEAEKFPQGFTQSIDELMKGDMGRTTFIETLPKDEYEVFTFDVPKGTRLQGGAEGTGKVELIDLKVSKEKRWSITILEEGKGSPEVGHQKYAVIPSRNAWFERVLTSPIAVEQLSSAKLERLMARYAGKEWLPSRLKHLDDAESEKADVIRGLKTYVTTSAEHAKRFGELYGKLEKEKQVLPAEFVKSLSNVGK